MQFHTPLLFIRVFLLIPIQSADSLHSLTNPKQQSWDYKSKVANTTRGTEKLHNINLQNSQKSHNTTTPLTKQKPITITISDSQVRTKHTNSADSSTDGDQRNQPRRRNRTQQQQIDTDSTIAATGETPHRRFGTVLLFEDNQHQH